MNEEWKDIPNYEGLYQVSNLGRVRSKRRILKPYVTKRGYCRVGLTRNSKTKHYMVHKLVMHSFIGEKYMPIDHIDCDKTNNKLENLEYVTTRENCIRAWKKGLCKITPYNERPVVQYDLDGNFINRYKSICEASRKTKIARQLIHSCCCNKINKTHNYKFRFDRDV